MLRKRKLADLQPQRHHPRLPEGLRRELALLVAEYGVPGYLAQQIGIGDTALSSAAAGMAVRRSTLDKCQQYLERRRERRVEVTVRGVSSDDELTAVLDGMVNYLRGLGVTTRVVPADAGERAEH